MSLPETEIISAYISGKSTRWLGNKYNVSHHTIKGLLTKKNIPLRDPKDIVGKRYGKWEVLSRTNKINHRKKPLYLCRCDCGTISERESASVNASSSCGCIKAKYLDSKRRPLGSKINSRGYVLLKIASDSGHDARLTNWMLEHHHVMEQIIGRKLFPDETVHHKNGIKSDNRAENLELWCSNHPAGQQTTDLVRWAKEILLRYDH
jgi:hypothetical protein